MGQTASLRYSEWIMFCPPTAEANECCSAFLISVKPLLLTSCGKLRFPVDDNAVSRDWPLSGTFTSPNGHWAWYKDRMNPEHHSPHVILVSMGLGRDEEFAQMLED